jgi:hypothetical protein
MLSARRKVSRPGQHRVNARLKEKPRSLSPAFFPDVRGKRDIDPTGEPIFQIPLRFPVTQQDQASHSHLLFLMTPGVCQQEYWIG